MEITYLLFGEKGGRMEVTDHDYSKAKHSNSSVITEKGGRES